MASTITFINEKGGIGKTSTCFNVAWEMSKKNTVLLIDLDGQRANLTYFCGVEKKDDLKTMYDLLQRGDDYKEAIVTIKKNLDIIPATVNVSGLMPQTAKESKMKKLLNELSEVYDYIFIDVSPSPNWGQYLALSACQYAIIPMLPDVASLEADNGIIESIEEVRESANPKLHVLGILFNRNENRSNLSKQVKIMADKVADKLGTKVFDNKIRNSVLLGENVYKHVGITDYDPKSLVAEDYINLIKEIKKEIKKNG